MYSVTDNGIRVGSFRIDPFSGWSFRKFIYHRITSARVCVFFALQLNLHVFFFLMFSDLLNKEKPLSQVGISWFRSHIGYRGPPLGCVCFSLGYSSAPE